MRCVVKLFKTVSLYLYFLTVMGCATSLTEDAKQVTMVRELTAEISRAYEFSGIITCQKEQNLASVERNRENCEIELKNKAAEKGAELIVVDAYETFPGTATVGVFMIGHTYSRK